MNQETYFRMCGTSMIAAAMILITLLSGLSVPNGFVGEVSAGGGNFAGGDGTADDPYQIEDVLDLQNMSADLSAHYVLVNDIDASATVDWNDGKGFDPVGNSSNTFTGSLGGQGHNIVELFINRISENNMGLFGYVGTGGSISDVSMVNVNISGKNDVGGLVGSNWGMVENCYATGTVGGGNSKVGGLVGSNWGTVQNSSATGTISGNSYVGGLVGSNLGTVQKSYATGDVSSDGGYVGGLVGFNGGTVSNSYATGNVSGDSRNVGGLVGYNKGTVENSYATGKVSGGGNVGGLVGSNYDGTVKNSYATGTVKGTGFVGGLVGLNDGGTVSNSYATGNVSGDSRNVGGLVGSNWGTVENCYTTGNVSGGGNVGGLVGSNYDGTVKNSFYCINHSTLNGKNIVTPYGIYEAQFEDWFDDRRLDINDYLHIISGTDYYSIGSISDLKDSLPFALEGYKFRQIADIDLSTEPGFYIPVFDAIEYDGDGHSISGLNLTYLNNGEKGLFGKLGSNSRISKISLINCKVSSGNYNVGGLVGHNDGGTVENSYATGTVSGNNRVGGLVGQNGGTVENSYATGTVSGDEDVGGLVGYNYYGTVQNSYATGNFSGNEDVGGLVGHNYHGTVQNCYATGNVNGNSRVGGLVGYNYHGTVQNSFWDIETSGQTTSAGGTGKNTRDMMKRSTFTDAGWNFEKTWSIIEGKSYPYLLAFTLRITTDDVTEAPEDDSYTVHYHAINPTNDTLTWSLNTSAGWLELNAATLTLEGTPTNDDVGSYWVNVSVSDESGGSDYTNFTLTVTNTNDPPEITFTPLITATEDTPYSLTLNATDIDPTNETLTWQLNTSAGWLELNAATITLEGTPTNDDVGTFWVNVSVSDESGGSDYTNFTLTVVNTNDPPVIQTTEVQDGTAGYAYNCSLIASDVDGDTLVWSLETNASWLTLDQFTGTLQGTPSSAGTFWVDVSVSDGNGGTDSVNLTITILPDLDGDGIPDTEDTDMDGDGVPNTSDAFAKDPAASKDSDEDGYPDEWNTGKNQTDSTTGLILDAFPKDPKKWEEEEEKSNENESFFFQKIGPLPLYAYLVFVIIGLAAGVGALKMKGGKSGGEAQKTDQSQQFSQQQSQLPPQFPQQQFQEPQQQQFPQQQPQPSQPQFQQPHTQQPQQTGNWTCPNCRAEVDAKYIFCTSCGHKK